MGVVGVVLDLSVGEVRVGRATLRGVADASAVEPGAVRLSDGVVLAPLGFGPRSTACAVHTDASGLGAAVLALSRRSGDARAGDGVNRALDDAEPADPAAVEALALHLAGARLFEGGPSFGDAAATMSRVYGWDADRVVDCCAQVVDHLATSVLDGGDGDDSAGGGWRSFVLVPDPDDPDPEDPDPAPVRDRLAADLLRRAAGRLDRRLLPVEEPAAWIGGDRGPTSPADGPGGRGLAAAGPRGSGAGPGVSLPGPGPASGSPEGVATAAPTRAATAGAPHQWAASALLTPRPWTVAAAEPPADAAGHRVDARPPGLETARETAFPHGAPEPVMHLPASAGATDVPWTRAHRAGAPSAGGEQVSPWAGPGVDAAWPGTPGPSPAPPVAGIGPIGWPGGPTASVASVASVADLLAAELDDESDLRGVLRW